MAQLAGMADGTTQSDYANARVDSSSGALVETDPWSSGQTFKALMQKYNENWSEFSADNPNMAKLGENGKVPDGHTIAIRANHFTAYAHNPYTGAVNGFPPPTSIGAPPKLPTGGSPIPAPVPATWASSPPSGGDKPVTPAAPVIAPVTPAPAAPVSQPSTGNAAVDAAIAQLHADAHTAGANKVGSLNRITRLEAQLAKDEKSDKGAVAGDNKNIAAEKAKEASYAAVQAADNKQANALALSIGAAQTPTDPTDPTGGDPTLGGDPTDPNNPTDPTSTTGGDPTLGGDPTDPGANPSDPIDPTSTTGGDPTLGGNPTDPGANPTDPNNPTDPTSTTGGDPTLGGDPTDPGANPTDPLDPTAGGDPTLGGDPTDGSDGTDGNDNSTDASTLGASPDDNTDQTSSDGTGTDASTLGASPDDNTDQTSSDGTGTDASTLGSSPTLHSSSNNTHHAHEFEVAISHNRTHSGGSNNIGTEHSQHGINTEVAKGERRYKGAVVGIKSAIANLTSKATGFRSTQARATHEPHTLASTIAEPTISSMPQLPSLPTAVDQTYTVAPGNTMSEIAQTHGVSLESLEAANPNLKDPNLIFPGQVIHMPNNSTASPMPTASPTDQSGSSVSVGVAAHELHPSPGGASPFPTRSTYPPGDVTSSSQPHEPADGSAGGGSVTGGASPFGSGVISPEHKSPHPGDSTKKPGGTSTTPV